MWPEKKTPSIGDRRSAIVDRRCDYRSSLLQMATCGASVALQIDLKVGGGEGDV